MRKKSKFGPKLHEFKRITTILESFLATSEMNIQKYQSGQGGEGEGVLVN